MAEEEEVLLARRAFPDAQALLAGPPLSVLPGLVPVGWHGTAAHPERGSFAVVQRGGDQNDLIGEVLRVTWRGETRPASVFVYCVGSAVVTRPVSLALRAFLSLAVLAVEELPCTVEVVA